MARRTLIVLFLLAPLVLHAQQWTQIGELTSARTNVAAVYIGAGKVLVMGGSRGIPGYDDPQSQPVATCEIVDVWRRTVSPAAPMSVARSEFAALRTLDSNVVVIGGVSTIDPNGEVTGSVELYDRQTARWRTVGMLTVARRQHVAGFIDSHRILVVGGRRRDYASLTYAEIFDLRTGRSAPATEFPYPINTSTLMASHSGDLVVVGGRTGGKNSERRAEVYSYDAAKNQWVLNSVLAQSVSAVSGLRLWDRRIIIAGGLHRDDPPEPATEVQLENIGKWKLISPMLMPRTNVALAQWSENRILVLGGYREWGRALATTEWIDINQHRSSPGPAMKVARERFSALSVPAAPGAEPHEHAIVAIGGWQGARALTASVEVLSPR